MTSSTGKPRHLTLAQWAQIEPDVTAIWDEFLTRTRTRPDRDPGLFNTLARYLAWCRFEQGHNVSRMLLRREAVAYYIQAALPGRTAKTRATYRGHLHSIGNAVLPAQLAPAQAERIPQRHASTPYTEHEIGRLLAWANSQPTVTARANANVLLALGLGAGLSYRETNHLRVKHLLIDANGIVITSPKDGRLIPLLAEWEDLLATAVDGLGPDDFVFRPGRIDSRRALTNAASDFIARTRMPHDGPSGYRLRATWIVRHLVHRVPFDILVRAAGLKEAVTLSRYLDHVPDAEHDAVRALLHARINADRRRPARPDPASEAP